MMDKHIRDIGGNLQFIVREISSGYTQILDKNGNLLGFVRDGDTFNNNGGLISRGENIGLLTVSQPIRN